MTRKRSSSNQTSRRLCGFSGLNEVPAALNVFFAFYPIVLVAVVGSVTIVLMLWFFLLVLGDGSPPPVLMADIEALRVQVEAGEARRDQLELLEKVSSAQIFPIVAGVQNFVLGVVESIVLSGLFSALALFRRRRPAESP